MTVDTAARQHAMRQWNAIACGEIDGSSDTADYFLRVEALRYGQHPWLRGYFGYASFAGLKVLEIGVGQGTDLMQFARAGARCFGVDITDNHLSLTDRNFKLQAQTVDLRKADATQLPFPDASIDCVYSFGVLHHIPEAERFMAEVFRVLKPGGSVMLALYYRWSAFHLFTKLLCHGIRCGWLWTKGYAGLLATIEEGADGLTTKPYVKLYSRREMRRLVRQFRVTDLSVHHLTADHFYPAVVGRALRRLIPRLEGLLGWYVTCKATKPA